MDLDNSQPKSPKDSSSSSSSSSLSSSSTTSTPKSPHDYSADRSLINDNDDSVTTHSPLHSPPPANIQDPPPHSPSEAESDSRSFKSIIKPNDFDWMRVFETKLHLMSFVGHFLVHGVVYPMTVVKSRVQISSTNKTATTILRELIAARNICDFYKGFGYTVLTAIPSRLLYLATVDNSKSLVYDLIKWISIKEDNKRFIANEFGAMASTLLAQTISTPGDLLRKTIMVQGYEWRVAYKGGVDIALKILKKDGFRGLYKGYGIPMITFSPTNIIWWGTYNTSKHIFSHFNHLDDEIAWKKSYLLQASSGLLAGGITSCFTQPFDTIQTRLQVNHIRKPTMKEIAKDLFKGNGLKAFYKGFGPRASILSITGATYAILCECFNL